MMDEEDLEFGSDLTSCSPAFIAEIFSKFAEMGLKNSNFTKEEVEDMVIKTLYGTAKLLHEKNMHFEDVISRVETPGGITEEGIKILDKELPKTFNELLNLS
jgi:pyrroline-5-carboxylate reductase